MYRLKKATFKLDSPGKVKIIIPGRGMKTELILDNGEFMQVPTREKLLFLFPPDVFFQPNLKPLLKLFNRVRHFLNLPPLTLPESP